MDDEQELIENDIRYCAAAESRRTIFKDLSKSIVAFSEVELRRSC